MNKYFLAALMLFSARVAVFGQDEYTTPLMYNPVLRQATAELSESAQRSTALTNDTLYLPFFDDFSGYKVWPSAQWWVDSSAFVNPNFALNPPSLGVATFDGLDLHGNPYDNTNINASGLCDVLTSRPVNLLNDVNGLPYNPSDSIFLIFYVERKGRGDNPEVTDSLVLQFWDPAAQTWAGVWKGTGTVAGDTVFTKVKISINDPIYRQNGFRFRFRNYGSKTGMLDLWHLDYVFLNKFLPPDFEIIRDYAYVYEGTSLLNNYSAIPWKHFSFLPAAQQQAMVKPAATLTLRNNNDLNPFPIKVAGTIYDQYGTPTNIVGGGGLNSIVVPFNSNFSPPAALNSNSFFQDPTTGEDAPFTAVYEIGQTSGGIVDDYGINDTLRYVQQFNNYYAYDDGTAELGYGINGVGASLAYKFQVMRGDTLRAIRIYFAQLGASVTNQLFRIAIWAGTTTPVGSPVYEKFNLTPNYTDSINGFYTYLTDPVFVPSGTWFFGFIQNNAVLLNLGLDVNTPADPTRKFINTTGSWVNSQLPGMWMIRPVFSSTPIDVGIDEHQGHSLVQVCPVPATDFLNVQSAAPERERYRLRIYDLTGRIVRPEMVFESRIDVSRLQNGFYFLEVTDPVSGVSTSTRFLVAGN